MILDSEARLIRWGGWAAVAHVVGVVAILGLYLPRAAAGYPNDPYDAAALQEYLAENLTFMTAAYWGLIAVYALWFPAYLGFHAALRRTRLPLLLGTTSGVLSGVLYMMLVAVFLGIAGLTGAYNEAGTRATAEVMAEGMMAMARPLGVLVYVFFAIGGTVFALASLDVHAVPNWMGIAGLVGAVGGGIGSALAIITGGAAALFPLSNVAYLLSLVWFAGMGVKMVSGKIPAVSDTGVPGT